MSIVLQIAVLATVIVHAFGQAGLPFDIESTAMANTTHCTATLDVSYYVGLSDQELFDIAINSTIGNCRIATGGPDVFCDLYVVVNNAPAPDQAGVPLNTDGFGTGCVKSPDISPKFQSTCFFQNAEYNLSQAWRDAMCTEMGVANAAAQLRYGIINGLCGDLPGTTVSCEYGDGGNGHDEDDCPDLPTCPKKKIRKICKCCKKICRKYDPDEPCLECYKYCNMCLKLCGDSIFQ